MFVTIAKWNCTHANKDSEEVREKEKRETKQTEQKNSKCLKEDKNREMDEKKNKRKQNLLEQQPTEKYICSKKKRKGETTSQRTNRNKLLKINNQ